MFLCRRTHVGGKLGSISGSVFTISGVSFDKAKVRCDDFWDVARESKADVNNSKDEYIRFVQNTIELINIETFEKYRENTILL